MQNTIVQPAGQSVIKMSGSTKKSAQSSDQTNKSSGENVDPYLQIFLSLLSQTQGSDAQETLDSDSSSSSVQQITPQQSLLNMLGLSDVNSSSNTINALNSGSVSDLTNTELSSTDSNEQSLSEILSTMNIQSVSDLLSALNLQSVTSGQTTASSQSTADLQSAADLMSAVNSLKAAIMKASETTQSSSNLQNSENTLGTQANQSTVNTQNSQGITSSYMAERMDVSQTQQSEQIVANESKDAYSDSKAAQISVNTATEAETMPVQTAAVSNQVKASTELIQKAKPENAPQATSVTQTQNSANKTETLEGSAKTEKDPAADNLLSAKDGSEIASKSSGSTSEAETDKKSTDKEIDLSKLQGDASASKEISNSGMDTKNAEKTAEPKISEQIATDVSKNMALGKNEFTVKLKPESLGEITVKLSEADGKTTLTITTASAHTAKLINDDLSDLKAAVSQMNVHVNEAVAKTSDTQQSSMQQFGMAFQQSTGQQYSGGQAYSSAAHSAQNDSDAAYTEQSTGNLPTETGKTIKSGGIDTYI